MSVIQFSGASPKDDNSGSEKEGTNIGLDTGSKTLGGSMIKGSMK